MNAYIDAEKYNAILSKINTPSDILQLNRAELDDLCWACRQRIIDATSQAGGHLASSLGTVELTVALYSVFNGEIDHFVWDVGHQAYTHKILTGRSEKISKMGTREGIAKFLSRAESPYDHFGAGHASTSISAGIGITLAKNFTGEKYDVICIIGDGALTGGMAYEALNQAGDLELNLKVVLNDNEMSIDPNVGALSKTFNVIQSNQLYNKIRGEVQSLEHNTGAIPKLVYGSLKRFDRSLMEFLSPASWFEKLGFRYLGPVDGHDISQLTKVLKTAQSINGPLIVHVITKKGRGYEYAEKDSLGYHGVTPFKPDSGEFIKAGGGVSYTSIWSAGIKEILETDTHSAVISAAMIGGTGLKKLQRLYPDRVFDVGIAEQHALTFSAGLAAKGIKPFVAIYSTFLQRAFDQLIHDVSLQNLPVRLVLDRAGFVGADGETHHGAFDLSYLRMMPNMSIMAPKDGKELCGMIKTMHAHNDGPIAVRFPRGNAAVFPESGEVIPAIPYGKAELIKDGTQLLVLAIGSMVGSCVNVLDDTAFDAVSVCLINARFVKPLDKTLILEKAIRASGIVTVEENMIAGGFGSAVSEMLNENGVYKPHLRLGMPDQFINYGSPVEQLSDAGLDENSLKASIIRFCRNIGI